VKMGDSLEEFVSNSQEYQADLLKFAIEAYRRGKGKITGYFQFMFIEPWEGITWAVVDLNREPKKGYYALQRASNPVLLSLVPSREAMEIGEIMLSEAWVINDLDRALDLEVTFRLEGPINTDLMRTHLHVSAQEAACFFTVGEFRESPSVEAEKVGRLYKTLRELQPGSYQLIGEIWEGKNLLSSNEFTFRYEEPIFSKVRE
jgi:beta-mannosidase